MKKLLIGFALLLCASICRSEPVPIISGSSAVGSSGAPATAGYVVTAADGDLSSEHVLTAGTGMSVTSASGTVTIAGTDASTSAKGIASFSSTFFSTSSGAVSIKADAIRDTEIDWSSFTSDNLTEGSTNLFLTGNEYQIGTSTMDDIVNGSTYKLTHNDFTTAYKGYLDAYHAGTDTPTFVNVTISTATPTLAAHAARKDYVDSVLSAIVSGTSWKAPITGRVADSTEVETATVGQRFIFLDDDSLNESTIAGWDSTAAETGFAVYSSNDTAQLAFDGTQWIQIGAGSGGSYFGGTGITITGSTISADIATAVLAFSGNDLTIKDGGITTAMVTGLTADDIAEGATNLYWTTEELQDLAGAMVGGTQTGITVTYQDASGDIDFVIADATVSVKGIASFATADFVVTAGAVTIQDKFLLNTGDIGTGVFDFGGADSFEIVNGTAPTVNAAGEIAIDTDADGNYIDQGLIVYYDGTQKMYGIAVDTLPSGDNYALTYDATNDKFVFEAQSGTGGSAAAGTGNTMVAIPLVATATAQSISLPLTWASLSGSTYYDFSKMGTLLSAKLYIHWYPGAANRNCQVGVVFGDLSIVRASGTGQPTIYSGVMNSAIWQDTWIDITSTIPSTIKYVTLAGKATASTATQIQQAVLLLEVSPDTNTLYQADGSSLTLTDTTFQINDSGVTETKLDITTYPTDTQVLSYDNATGKMKWVTASSHDATTGDSHIAVSVDQELSMTDITLQQGLSIILSGSDTVDSGILADLEVPYACTVQSVTLLADASGSIVVEVWKDTYGNYPPTADDKIATETMTSVEKYQDGTAANWTNKTLDGGDILRFYVPVDSVVTMKRCLFAIKVLKR